MYPETLPTPLYTSTFVKIRYDCHDEERMMKWCDAKKNAEKNDGKHICRRCWLRSDANPAKQKDTQAKIKKTNLEKYGTELPMNTKERIETRSAAYQNKEFVAKTLSKRRKTNLEKYGADHPMKNEEVKERQQSVLMDRYGVKVPLQSPEILARMQQKLMDRLGVKNVGQLPEVQAKMAQTNLERYGVEHYNQLPEMRDYLREHCPGWLAESYAAGGPNKGIVRPDEWNQKQRETVCLLIFEGKWNSGPKTTKKGWFRSRKCSQTVPFFRSSWELAVMMHLDENDLCKSYDYEPFSIPYVDLEGIPRSYIPDFLIHWHGKHSEVWEVKSSYLLQLDKMIGKMNKAQEYFNSVGLFFQILSASEITRLGYDLATIIHDERVQLMVD